MSTIPIVNESFSSDTKKICGGEELPISTLLQILRNSKEKFVLGDEQTRLRSLRAVANAYGSDVDKSSTVEADYLNSIKQSLLKYYDALLINILAIKDNNDILTKDAEKEDRSNKLKEMEIKIIANKESFEASPNTFDAIVDNIVSMITDTTELYDMESTLNTELKAVSVTGGFVHKYSVEATEVVKQFGIAFSDALKQFITALVKMGRSLETHIPLNDASKAFRDALNTLPDIQLGRRDEYVLIGINDLSSDRTTKASFMEGIKLLINILHDIKPEHADPGNKILQDVKESLTAIKNLIDTYSDKIVRLNSSSSTGGFLDLSKEQPVANLPKSLTDAINDFINRWYVAHIKKNLRNSVGMIKDQVSDYEKTMERAIHNIKDDLNMQKKKIMEDVDKLSQGDASKRSVIKDFINRIFDCKAKFYDTLDSIDYLIKEFGDTIRNDPDALADMTNILSSVQNIVSWYSPKESGKNLWRFFESFAQDDKEISEIDKASGHYYDYIQDKLDKEVNEKPLGDRPARRRAGTRLNPVMDVDISADNFDTYKNSIDSSNTFLYSMMESFVLYKNFLNGFFRLGPSKTYLSSSKKILSPVEIYKNIKEYIRVSSMIVAYGDSAFEDILKRILNETPDLSDYLVSVDMIKNITKLFDIIAKNIDVNGTVQYSNATHKEFAAFLKELDEKSKALDTNTDIDKFRLVHERKIVHYLLNSFSTYSIRHATYAAPAGAPAGTAIAETHINLLNQCKTYVNEFLKESVHTGNTHLLYEKTVPNIVIAGAAGAGMAAALAAANKIAAPTAPESVAPVAVLDATTGNWTWPGAPGSYTTLSHYDIRWDHVNPAIVDQTAYEYLAMWFGYIKEQLDKDMAEDEKVIESLSKSVDRILFKKRAYLELRGITFYLMGLINPPVKIEHPERVPFDGKYVAEFIVSILDRIENPIHPITMRIGYDRTVGPVPTANKLYFTYFPNLSLTKTLYAADVDEIKIDSYDKAVVTPELTEREKVTAGTIDSHGKLLAQGKRPIDILIAPTRPSGKYYFKDVGTRDAFLEERRKTGVLVDTIQYPISWDSMSIVPEGYSVSDINYADGDVQTHMVIVKECHMTQVTINNLKLLQHRNTQVDFPTDEFGNAYMKKGAAFTVTRAPTEHDIISTYNKLNALRIAANTDATVTSYIENGPYYEQYTKPEPVETWAPQPNIPACDYYLFFHYFAKYNGSRFVFPMNPGPLHWDTTTKLWIQPQGYYPISKYYMLEFHYDLVTEAEAIEHIVDADPKTPYEIIQLVTGIGHASKYIDKAKEFIKCIRSFHRKKLPYAEMFLKHPYHKFELFRPTVSFAVDWKKFDQSKGPDNWDDVTKRMYKRFRYLAKGISNDTNLYRELYLLLLGPSKENMYVDKTFNQSVVQTLPVTCQFTSNSMLPMYLFASAILNARTLNRDQAFNLYENISTLNKIGNTFKLLFSSPKWIQTVIDRITAVDKTASSSRYSIVINDIKRSEFDRENKYFVRAIRAMAMKMLTAIGVYTMFDYPTTKGDIGIDTRLLIGGFEFEELNDVVAIPEAAELYYRIPRLMEFYVHTLHYNRDASGSTKSTVPRKIALVPSEGGTTYTSLLQLFFGILYTRTKGDYSELECKKIIKEINNVYLKNKGKTSNDIINEIVLEVSRRYGVVTLDESKEFMKNYETQRYPTRSALSSTDQLILPEEEKTEAVSAVYVDNLMMHIKDSASEKEVDTLETNVELIRSFIDTIVRTLDTGEIFEKDVDGAANFKSKAEYIKKVDTNVMYAVELIKNLDDIDDRRTIQRVMFRDSLAYAINITRSIFDFLAAMNNIIYPKTVEPAILDTVLNEQLKYTDGKYNWTAAETSINNSIAVEGTILAMYLRTATKFFKAGTPAALAAAPGPPVPTGPSTYWFNRSDYGVGDLARDQPWVDLADIVKNMAPAYAGWYESINNAGLLPGVPGAGPPIGLDDDLLNNVKKAYVLSTGTLVEGNLQPTIAYFNLLHEAFNERKGYIPRALQILDLFINLKTSKMFDINIANKLILFDTTKFKTYVEGLLRSIREFMPIFDGQLNNIISKDATDNSIKKELDQLETLYDKYFKIEKDKPKSYIDEMFTALKDNVTELLKKGNLTNFLFEYEIYSVNRGNTSKIITPNDLNGTATELDTETGNTRRDGPPHAVTNPLKPTNFTTQLDLENKWPESSIKFEPIIRAYLADKYKLSYVAMPNWKVTLRLSDNDISTVGDIVTRFNELLYHYMGSIAYPNTGQMYANIYNVLQSALKENIDSTIQINDSDMKPKIVTRGTGNTGAETSAFSVITEMLDNYNKYDVRAPKHVTASNILFRTNALILNALGHPYGDKKATTSQLLIQTFSDVSDVMKGIFKQKLPVFIKHFEELSSKCDVLNELIGLSTLADDVKTRYRNVCSRIVMVSNKIIAVSKQTINLTQESTNTQAQIPYLKYEKLHSTADSIFNNVTFTPLAYSELLMQWLRAGSRTEYVCTRGAAAPGAVAALTKSVILYHPIMFPYRNSVDNVEQYLYGTSQLMDKEFTTFDLPTIFPFTNELLKQYNERVQHSYNITYAKYTQFIKDVLPLLRFSVEMNQLKVIYSVVPLLYQPNICQITDIDTITSHVHTSEELILKAYTDCDNVKCDGTPTLTAEEAKAASPINKVMRGKASGKLTSEELRLKNCIASLAEYTTMPINISVINRFMPFANIIVYDYFYTKRMRDADILVDKFIKSPLTMPASETFSMIVKLALNADKRVRFVSDELLNNILLGTQYAIGANDNILPIDHTYVLDDNNVLRIDHTRHGPPNNTGPTLAALEYTDPETPPAKIGIVGSDGRPRTNFLDFLIYKGADKKLVARYASVNNAPELRNARIDSVLLRHLIYIIIVTISVRNEMSKKFVHEKRILESTANQVASNIMFSTEPL